MHSHFVICEDMQNRSTGKWIPKFGGSEGSLLLLYECGGEMNYLDVFYCSSVVLSFEIYCGIGNLTTGCSFYLLYA